MTIYLMLITGAFSILGFSRARIIARFDFNPSRIVHKREVYRLLSSGFLHADWLHLALNMFVLFNFGPLVESHYTDIAGEKGPYLFLIMYCTAIVASILPTLNKHKNNSYYHGLGASGAVSAVLFSSVLFRPMDKLCFIFGLCLPGILMGAGYLLYSYYAARKSQDHINHDAHFWGALYGILFSLAIHPAIGLNFLNQIQAAGWSGFLPGH